jgi:hypothetical protein
MSSNNTEKVKRGASLSTDDIGLQDAPAPASNHQSQTEIQATAPTVYGGAPADAADGSPQKAKGGSRVLSMGSRTSSNNAEHRFAREISETFTWKLREMKWCLLALVSNILLLAAVDAMKNGAVVSLNKEVASTWEGIVMEILLLATNIFTILAMDSGVAAFFGFQMATRGRSMAVIGFSQTPAVFKMSFANDLSLNSSVRKILNRLAFLWAIMEILKVITPIGASALTASPVRSDAFTVDCIIFQQQGKPVDRNWPNVEAEIGFAELIFGKSIGRLRSQEEVDITTAIVGPQLIGVVMDGDTIVGDGFLLDILSDCQCSASHLPDDLESVGVPTANKQAFTDAYLAVNSRNIFMVSALEKNDTAIVATGMLVNTPLCGGLNMTGMPVCRTVFSNHRTAEVMVEYMTDGTTASIAQKFAFIRKETGEADLGTWAYAALNNILGAGVQTIPLPSQVPAMMTPILWWTTADLMAIDPALLEAGLETFYTILFRAGIQRSYATEGNKCVRNIVDPAQTILSMSDYGYQTALAALIIQLIFNAISAAAFVPWLLSNVPAGPAIRAMNESIYFTTLLADSNLGDNLKGLCNAPTHAIWQSLDVIVRIGESIMTQDEVVGHITMDKPKVVRPLVNARCYA